MDLAKYVLFCHPFWLRLCSLSSLFVYNDYDHGNLEACKIVAKSLQFIAFAKPVKVFCDTEKKYLDGNGGMINEIY